MPLRILYAYAHTHTHIHITIKSKKYMEGGRRKGRKIERRKEKARKKGRKIRNNPVSCFVLNSCPDFLG